MIWMPLKGIHVGGDDIGDQDVAHDAGRFDVGAAVAGTGRDVDRISGDIHHGDVIDGDVLQNSAIDFFEGKAPAGAEGAVGDGNVAEAAVCFGAHLDAAGFAGTGKHAAIN